MVFNRLSGFATSGGNVGGNRSFTPLCISLTTLVFTLKQQKMKNSNYSLCNHPVRVVTRTLAYEMIRFLFFFMAPKLAIVTQHFYSLRFGGVGPALEEYSKIGSIHLFWTNLRCPRVQNTKESVQIKKGKPMNCALSKCSVDGLCVVRSRCFCLFR